MKKILLPVILVALLGGGYYAYVKGMIPGLESAEQKAANELKTKIESMKGDKLGEAYKNLILEMIPVQDFIPEGEQREAFMKGFDKGFGKMSVSYDSIKTRTEMGKGIVDLENVVVKIDQSGSRTPEEQVVFDEMKSNPFFAAFASGKTEYVYDKLSVIKHIDAPNHYVMDCSGVMDLYMVSGDKKLKFLSIKSGLSVTEFKWDKDKGFDLLSMIMKDSDIIEARGNTSVVKIGYTEFSYNKQAPKAGDEAAARFKYIINDVTFGDMIKVLIGNIEPVSFGFDVSYSGDNLLELLKKAADEEKRKAISNIAGGLKLNDLYLKMGKDGLMGNGNINLEAHKPDGAEKLGDPITNGKFDVTLAGYQKLIDYFTKFFPVPKEELDKGIAFLKEIGEDKGQDIGFSIEIKDSEVLVNGKTEKQIDEIEAKYFPPAAADSEFTPAAPEGVESAPLEAPAE